MTKGLHKQATVNVLTGGFHIPCRELFFCLVVILTGLASKEIFGLKYSFLLGNTGDMVVEEKINSFQVQNTTITPFYYASHTVPDVLTAPGKVNTSSLLKDKNDWLNVPHLFTCHNATSAPHGLPGRNKKLVFVHIFKTAGSTLRGLFKRYAEKCHAGWQLTIRCTGVNETSVLPESVMSGSTEYTSWWNFGNNQPCVPKSGVNRKGRKLNISSSSFNSDFLEENIDILGGHLELGSADYTWTKFEDVRYVAFFREAVSMFVSGKMYNKQLTLEQHLKAIQDTVESNLAQGIYNSRYSSYLLTPFQKAALKRQQRKLSPQERAALIQSNIMNYRIICGLTERMVESLEILNHLIDSDDGARSIFEIWGMPNKDGNLVNNLKHFNTMAQREGVSTKTVIEELKKNETFYKLLTEYVKYEQQVTDFATSVHIQQYASIKKGIINKQ